MKQPPLIAVGVVLLAIGLAIFGVLAFGRPDPADRSAAQPAHTSEEVAPTSEGYMPSRLWAIVAGVSLACGGACVGIGMNRWRSQPTA